MFKGNVRQLSPDLFLLLFRKLGPIVVQIIGLYSDRTRRLFRQHLESVHPFTSALEIMKTFLALLAFGLFVNLLFAALTMVFFHGQINGADSFVDYFHYAIGSLTTAGTGGITPESDAAKLWTSFYILVV